MKDEMMTDNYTTHTLIPQSLDGTDAVGTADDDAQATPPAAAAVCADDLHAVMDVPVRLRAVLGRARMDLHRLLRLKAGEVVELDRRAGEPVDIFVNNRFIARGEVVLIDNVLGVTLTEIVRQDR